LISSCLSLNIQFSGTALPTVRSVNGVTLIRGVELISMKGELVRSLRFDDVPEAKVNIDDLRPGRYFVVVSGDSDWSSAIVVR